MKKEEKVIVKYYHFENNSTGHMAIHFLFKSKHKTVESYYEWREYTKKTKDGSFKFLRLNKEKDNYILAKGSYILWFDEYFKNLDCLISSGVAEIY